MYWFIVMKTTLWGAILILTWCLIFFPHVDINGAQMLVPWDCSCWASGCGCDKVFGLGFLPLSWVFIMALPHGLLQCSYLYCSSCLTSPHHLQTPSSYWHILDNSVTSILHHSVSWSNVLGFKFSFHVT